MNNCFFVGLGGFIGSVCRYLIGLIPLNATDGFPWKTLAINVLGAFLLSVIATGASRHPGIPPYLVLMLKVGVCGGFTTFSTFAFESSTLYLEGHASLAVIYIAASVILGIAAIFLGQGVWCCCK